MTENILKPVEAQLKAYNNRDIDNFVSNFSTNCICEDSNGNILIQGRDAMHVSYGKMFADSPNLHCNIVSRTVVGNYIFDEERVTGRGGSEEERHVMAVYTVYDGLIQHVRFYR